MLAAAAAIAAILVWDGDSLEIDGAQIRLWGVDAPELAQTCERPDGRLWACGAAAKAALVEMFAGQPVECQARGRDHYGRTVARCSAGPVRDIGAEMVRRGLAMDSTRYSGGAYAGEERAARKARRGIWNGSFIEPWKWRRDHKRDRKG